MINFEGSSFGGRALTGVEERRSSHRIELIDALRGCALLLVVFDHSCGFGLMPVPDAYRAIGVVMLPLRMPMLFLLSGFVGHVLLAQPVRAINRAMGLLWLCAVWLPIAMALRLVYYSPYPLTVASFSPLSLWVELLAPSTHIWFIWVLAIYTVVTPALAHVNRQVVVALAGLLSLLACANYFEVHPSQNNIFKYFFFYVSGALYAAEVRNYLTRPISIWAVAATILAFTLVSELHSWLKDEFDSRLFGLAIRIMGCAVAINIGKMLFGRRQNGLLVWIGQNTLQVYLIHSFIIALLTHHVFPVTAGLESHLLIPMIAALSVGGSLLTYKILQKPGTIWLFRVPGWFQINVSAKDRSALSG